MGKATWERLWKRQRKNDGIFHKIVWKLRHDTSAAYAQEICKRLGDVKRPRILEIGCGSALTFQYIRKKLPDCSLLGLDFSPAALRIARSRNPGTKFICGDARRLPLKDGTYDFTYSLGLIEHFSRKDALRIISEHARVTRKGGYVMIVVPAKYSVINLARIIAGKRWPWGFEDPFSKSGLMRLMEEAGLRGIRIRRAKTIVLIATGIK